MFGLNNISRHVLAGAVIVLALSSCSKSESYSELLRDEERAVNWFLAQQNVEVSAPADSIFEVGENAPFYRMDADGTIYMQVIRIGDKENRPQKDDKVYFRFSRQNIKMMYEGTQDSPYGNADDMASDVGPTYFFYGNKTYPTTQQFGTGIQLPMDYFGYGTEVNLVLKSYSGFVNDQSLCQPYLYNVKYYKAEY
ncbi:MAG: DUF4827 domain-containing protein [Muribaculaceae bacterium]|nr:DUF4827 domain-containing protein [Muribaculaceae bacterium]